MITDIIKRADNNIRITHEVIRITYDVMRMPHDVIRMSIDAIKMASDIKMTHYVNRMTL